MSLPARAVLTAAAALLAAPSTGLAASVSSSGGFVAFEGTAAADSVTIGRGGDQRIVFTTLTATAVGSGCQKLDAASKVVACAPPSETFKISVQLDEGVNVVKAGADVPALFVSGGSGSDDVTGGPGDDGIIGGGGKDVLRGGAGDDAIRSVVNGADTQGDELDGGPGADLLSGTPLADTLRGGPGDDLLTALAGADTIDGGADVDLVDYTTSIKGVTVALSGGAATGAGAPGEGDKLSGIEDVDGSPQADVLTGDAGPNELKGLSGDDQVTGGGGPDVLLGGGGVDKVEAADGTSDRVRCGGQTGDLVRADQTDALADDCPAAGRTVVGGAGTGTPPKPVAGTPGASGTPGTPGAAAGDTTAPKTAGTFPSSIGLAKLRRSGYAFVVNAGEPARVLAELVAKPRTFGFGAAAVGELVVGRKSVRTTGSSRIVVKLPTRFTRKLKRGGRLRLVLRITDVAGNRATKSVKIRLR